MVRAKKHLGQHFLKEENTAYDIVKLLKRNEEGVKILEIGPGKGVFTQFLFEMYGANTLAIDVDQESVRHLKKRFPDYEENIILGDFLREDLKHKLGDKYLVIGNFPYNISSQIFFKILEDRDAVLEVACILQKEVAERLVSPPGNKAYGILSVLLQAWYDLEYVSTLPASAFEPAPKVSSGIIRLSRNNVTDLGCSEELFKQVVKQGFQNRRKTLRNALKPLNLNDEVKQLPVLDKRAEALSVNDFVELTNAIESGRDNRV